MHTAVEKSPETQLITLDQVNVRNLPELQGWKEKQHQIVKENPFVAITDNKSYEEGKKNRTALVTARTDIQKQDKLIASKLKELRAESGKVASELIEITLPHEEKQQEEVKKYEAEKEAERLEKERIERERKQKIQNSINSFYDSWKAGIKELKFKNIEAFQNDLSAAIESKSEEDLEEFEMDLAEKSRLLNEQLTERVDYLEREEANRVEREKLAKERAEYEAKKAQEEAERKAQEEKEREEREADARELAIQRQELEAEREKAIKDRYDIRKAKLAELGFSLSHMDQFVNDEYTIVLEVYENDVLNASNDHFEIILSNAESKLSEEKSAWEKHQKEEKARQEAEEKRKAELQPDREKLIAYIDSISFSMESPNLKDEAAQNFMQFAEREIKELQLRLIEQAKELK